MIALFAVLLQQNFAEIPKYPIPTDAELRGALGVYREYGLPLPPQGSQLVKYPVGKSFDRDGNRTVHWDLAIKLPGRVPRLLRGLDYLPASNKPNDRLKAAGAQPISAEEAKAYHRSSFNGLGAKFEIDRHLAMAIQMYSMGDLDLAQHFASGEEYRYYGEDRTVGRRTYLLVAKYYLSQYEDKDADVAKIAHALAGVREHLDDGIDWNWIQRQADAVIAAQQPFTSRAGTDERLVDELIYYGLAELEPAYDNRLKDPYFLAILARGVAIVPTLIKHLDDSRATRRLSRASHNGIDNFTFVQSLCEEIVSSLMSPKHVNRRVIISDVKPQDWWDSVKRLPEIEILKRAIFHDDDELNPNYGISTISLNVLPVDIFVLRYPNQIPDLYLESLDHKKNSNEYLARIIDESSLSVERKSELFREAIARGTASHKSTATWYIRKYDKKAAREALRDALLVDAPFGDALKDHKALRLAGQVMEVGDADLVELLVRQSQKEDSGVRINVISGIYENEWKDKNNSLRLMALKLFLEDATTYITEMQRMKSGDDSDIWHLRLDPSYLWTFENPFQVRDCAAWCIGRLIGVLREPQNEWRPEDWDQYHEIVLDALRKRDGGGKKPTLPKPGRRAEVRGLAAQWQART